MPWRDISRPLICPLSKQRIGRRSDDSSKLDRLQSLAAYKDDGSGLVISGDRCVLNMTYYRNYFDISRRNVSNIDSVSVGFDAAGTKTHGGLELDPNIYEFG